MRNWDGRLPDPAAHNRELARYRDVIRDVAADRKIDFVDLFEFFENQYAGGREHRSIFTTNGVHLSEAGYLALACRLGRTTWPWSRSAGLRVSGWGLTARSSPRNMSKTSRMSTTPRGLRFEVIGDFLPLTSLAEPQSAGEENRSARTVSIHGLMPGRYELKIDGTGVATALAAEWDHGLTLCAWPRIQQSEKLRAAINRKNELFFHRWRPQNNTYLFLFRKHEQGNNAVEIPQFDPLVAEQEQMHRAAQKTDCSYL